LELIVGSRPLHVHSSQYIIIGIRLPEESKARWEGAEPTLHLLAARHSESRHATGSRRIAGLVEESLPTAVASERMEADGELTPQHSEVVVIMYSQIVAMVGGALILAVGSFGFHNSIVSAGDYFFTGSSNLSHGA